MPSCFAFVFSADDGNVSKMQRWLITIGLILLFAGLLWPLLSKLGLGRLPGDIRIEREGFSFYFPLMTGLIVSVVISLILWFLRR